MSTPFILAETVGLLDTAKEVGVQFGWDPALFFSQIVSFLLVAWLLQRFAYKPVLNVLEERRQRIAESLENAEKIKAQLAAAETQHAEILARANQEAQTLIKEARTSAEALAEKRQQAAIAEAGQIVAKAREALETERERVFGELRQELGRLVVDTTAKVTGKILTDADRQRLAKEAVASIAE